MCVSSDSMPTGETESKRGRGRETKSLNGVQHFIRRELMNFVKLETHLDTHTHFSSVTQPGDWCLYRFVAPSLSAAMETAASWITIISLMCPLPLLLCYFNPGVYQGVCLCACTSARVGEAEWCSLCVCVCIITCDRILWMWSKCVSGWEDEINYMCLTLGFMTV